MMRRCRGCRAVKRVKTSWFGNAMAMMHYLRIVNARGRQKWHGHDHKDKAHPTPRFGVPHACATVRSRPGLFHASSENYFERCPLSTELKQLARCRKRAPTEADALRLYKRPGRGGLGGHPWTRYYAPPDTRRYTTQRSPPPATVRSALTTQDGVECPRGVA